MNKRVLTYGTFDVFHYGHERILKRAKALGSDLFIGVSSDEFNRFKGKNAFDQFLSRAENVKAFMPDAIVFAENSFEQKFADIKALNIDVLVMGDDWKGKFDYLKDVCEVIYLERTPGISSTMIRNAKGIEITAGKKILNIMA